MDDEDVGHDGEVIHLGSTLKRFKNVNNRGKNNHRSTFVILDRLPKDEDKEDDDDGDDDDEDETTEESVAAQKLSSSISSLIRAAAASFGEKPSSPPSAPGLTLQALTQRPYNLAGNSPLASALGTGMGGGLTGIGGVVNGLRGRNNGLRGGAAWGNRIMNYGPNRPHWPVQPGPNTAAPFAPSQQYNSPLAVGGPAGLGSWQTNAGAWAQYGLGTNARSDDEEEDYADGSGDLDGDESRVTPLRTPIGVIKLVDKVGSKRTKSETKEYTFRRKGRAEAEQE